MTDPAVVLADLLRVAAEDVGLHLDARLELRLAQRLAELLDVAGLAITAHPNHRPKENHDHR